MRMYKMKVIFQEHCQVQLISYTFEAMRRDLPIVDMYIELSDESFKGQFLLRETIDLTFTIDDESTTSDELIGYIDEFVKDEFTDVKEFKEVYQ